MIRVAHCHVSNTDVPLLVDMEGGVNRVVCTWYSPAEHRCLIKQRSSTGGPLAEMIERTAEHRLTERGARCHFLP